MRIAIIGAGFAGLATARRLLALEEFQGAEVVIMDKNGVGGGASSVSAGLLHRFSGSKAKKNRKSDEGVQATLKLLKEASAALGEPVFNRSGLLRIAVTDEQKHFFHLSAEENEGVRWLCAEECRSLADGLAPEPGIFIEDAYTVDSSRYLLGLYKVCEGLGARFEQKAVQSLKQLDGYDLIIAALGADTLLIEELRHLPVKLLKGQILEFNWPEPWRPPSTALSSQVYMLMKPDGKSCIAGSTFERNFATVKPDIRYASSYILPRLRSFLPRFNDIKPELCRAGIRATAPRHLPLIMRVDKKCWVITGLGSKGLLYHALYSKDLLDMVWASNPVL